MELFLIWTGSCMHRSCFWSSNSRVNRLVNYVSTPQFLHRCEFDASDYNYHACESHMYDRCCSIIIKNPHGFLVFLVSIYVITIHLICIQIFIIRIIILITMKHIINPGIFFVVPFDIEKYLSIYYIFCYL